MAPPRKPPSASLWHDVFGVSQDWEVFGFGQARPSKARYTRHMSFPDLGTVTLYVQDGAITVLPIARINVPHTPGMTPAQQQELANAMLQVYVIANCSSDD
jgi:hypothetical protein